ncbi:unnamed protein product [Kuraishia capsulata CBS 1993]|uniref:Protein kinase domain-containing protein n=1 Tax=Kuraishia capsulata CBS 1993 TaxID=1382522 RepID=W6MV73_9ASCO|nr:uncharacterized protein KUCA_T00002081001 [Kuraishia capsulata CBS 1993]CDK26110.1 unnamed protein product [Kuraishia capsulata CBS 1993]
MNFLANALGSLTGSSIPYNIGDRIVTGVGSDYSSNSIWNVYLGTKKENNMACTIFEFELTNPSTSKYVQLARNALKKQRSMKLPSVLNTLDTFETDSVIYIVTERVQPLETVLANNEPLSQQAFIFGIYQITTALKFINLEGGSLHGNVSSSSIYITESGEWRLGGFELATNIKTDDFGIFNMAYQLPSFNSSLAPPEFINQGASVLPTLGRHAVKLDSFKLGVLIYELFNEGKSVTDISQTTNMTKIPRNMGAHVKKLLNQSVNVRYSAEQFLKTGETSFFETPLIKCYKELSEISFRADDEKLSFLDTLEGIENDCPPGFVESKLLPELIKQFGLENTASDGTSQSALLYHILKFSPSLKTEAYSRLVKPVIIKSFTLADRAVRMMLLTSLPRYVESFTNYEVSDKIFNHLITGFNDTSPAIREETVKAILPIADKLTDRQLNNDLLRHLAKSQNDEKPEIRTNTVICLGKIAGLLNHNSRPGVLVTAFTKSLKDPFVPARISAVMSLASCIDYFSPEVCCSRVLSAVAPALLDQSSKVRMEAQAAFDSYVNKIREAAADLPEDKPDTIESQSQEQQHIQDNMGAFTLGWGALSKISDKIGGKIVDPPDSTRDSTPDLLKPATSETGIQQLPKVSNLKIDDDFEEEDNGWGFDIDEEEQKPATKPAPKTALRPSKPLQTTRSVPAKRIPKAPGLQLKPTNKLKLDLEIDEDGWNDGW